MLHLSVADGVHRIEDAYANWYAVEDGHSLTIVDSGHPRSWRSLRELLRRIGRNASAVEAIILTHGHFDHVGFAERGRSELGVPVLVHENDVELAQHPWRYEHERSRLPYMLRYPRFDRAFGAMALMGALFVKGVRQPKPFQYGTTLDVPGNPVVLATPGHTNGHCSFHFRDRDTVIVGDALVTYDPYTAGTGPRIIAGAATADSRQALHSLDALRETGASTLLPGHGHPWTEGAEAAVAHARRVGAS
jgi:glyoxylase-like metal-dependent hydrolase (beta-lactamase superfamily II)